MSTGGSTGRTSLVSVKSTAFAKAIFFAPHMVLAKALVLLGDLYLRFPRDDVGKSTSAESSATDTMTSSKDDSGLRHLRLRYCNRLTCILCQQLMSLTERTHPIIPLQSPGWLEYPWTRVNLKYLPEGGYHR